MRQALRKNVWLSIAASVATLAVAAPASANDSFAINLRAQVAPFCRISADEGDGVALATGAMMLGAVRETCNSANGYVVRARVQNVASGTLFAGAQQAQRDGEDYLLARSQASRIESIWRLEDWRLSDPAAPVRLVVTISPI